MKIQTQLDLRSYLNLTMNLSLRRPLFGFVVGFCAFGMIDSIDAWIKYDKFPYGVIAFLFWIAFYLIFNYLRAKRNFKSNKQSHEKIEYDFTEDRVIVQGETFHSEMGWNEVYKITELRNWVLIYQGIYSMNAIKKDSFGNQIDEFRKLVRTKGVKAKLKG